MKLLPNYIGPVAFGVKLPVIRPGDNIEDIVYSHLEQCNKDMLLKDNSIVCITESVVARSQNNYVTLDDVAQEVRTKLNLEDKSELGVLFPIASRNRFSAILTGIARAVPKGQVYVQFPGEKDEVGNELVNHPCTGINYLELYEKIIKEEGANPCIRNNDLLFYPHIKNLDGIIIASIHNRETDLEEVRSINDNCITLKDICNEPKENGTGYSEWGVLGSNLSEGKLKLAPRNAKQLSFDIRERVKKELKKNIQVMVYGDGAYKDPSTGIYELADPVVSFGNTPGLENPRLGVKYKYLADKALAEGLNKQQIEEMIKEESKKLHETNSIKMEGTTPRPFKDIAGSLADLVSGSADAGTPLVIINGLYNPK